MATLTVYPNADPESTTVDGAIAYAPGETTWSALRGAATGSVAFPSLASGISFGYVEAGAASGKYAAIRRSFFLFDLSSIAGAIVSAATLSLYGDSKSDPWGITPDLDIVSSNPASNTNLVTADYDQLGTTVFGSVGYTAFSTTGYNDITLDANGIAQATPGGIAKYGARLSPDTDNSAPTWGASKSSNMQGFFADETGTTKDPKLTVTYSYVVNVTVTPDALVLTGSIPAPSFIGGANFDAAVLGLTGSLPAPVVTTGSNAYTHFRAHETFLQLFYRL